MGRHSRTGWRLFYMRHILGRMDTYHPAIVEALHHNGERLDSVHPGDSIVFLRLSLRMQNIRALIAQVDMEDWLVVAAQQEAELLRMAASKQITELQMQSLYNLLHGKDPSLPAAFHLPPVA